MVSQWWKTFHAIRSHFPAQDPNDSIVFCIKMETPECLVPCAIAEICRRMTQLRKELVEVSEQQCNTMRAPCKDGNQMKLALKAMDDAILKLQECQNSSGKSMPIARQEPTSTMPRSIFERASLFQSWDMKRKHQEQNQPPAQQQKAAKSQTSRDVLLL